MRGRSRVALRRELTDAMHVFELSCIIPRVFAPPRRAANHARRRGDVRGEALCAYAPPSRSPEKGFILDPGSSSSSDVEFLLPTNEFRRASE